MMRPGGRDRPPPRNPSSASRTALADGFRRWRGALADALHRVQESGELADGVDPDTAAAALLAAYQGGVLLTSGTGDLEAHRLALTTFQTTVLIDRHR